MDRVLEGVPSALLEFGVLGLACLVLGLTVRLLFQAYVNAQEGRLSDQKVHQENRVADLKTIVDVVNKSTATYDAMATATLDRTRATDAVAQAQKATADALERHADAIKEALDRIEAIDRAQDRILMQAQSCKDAMEALAQRIDELARHPRRG